MSSARDPGTGEFVGAEPELKLLGLIDLIGDTHAYCTLKSKDGDEWLANIALSRFNGMEITDGDYFDVLLADGQMSIKPSVFEPLTAEQVREIEERIIAIFGDKER